MNKLKKLLDVRWWIEKIELFFDELRGGDFINSMSNSEAGTDSNIANTYSPSSRITVRKICKELNVDSNDSIIDFGCGKGDVLRQLQQFNFGLILGIELSKELASICRKNMQILHYTDIQVVEGDARGFNEELDGFNMFYFYNPFPEMVFEAVYDNICDSILRKPREATIIYVNPVCRNVIERDCKFSIVNEQLPSFWHQNGYVIYRNDGWNL